MTADQRAALVGGTSAGTNQSAATIANLSPTFVATNPTPGTGIAFAVTTAYSATAGAFMAFKNNASADQGTITTLKYIKLLTTVVPASGTSAQFAFYLDTASSNRYTSGGSSITPINANVNDSTAALTQLWAGALATAAAGSSARLASRGTLRGVIPTVNDEFLIDFNGSTGGSYVSAAASGRICVNAPPLIIGPQMWCLLHLWFPSNASTPASFEFETAWGEA